MYERLLEQADLEQERFARERAVWQATEASLRQEAAELRSQLLYVLAQLNTLQPGGSAAGGPPGGAPSARSYVGSRPQAAIAGQQPAGALPSSASSASSSPATAEPSLSPAEQVKAVVEAAKAGSAPTPPQPTAAAADDVRPSAAWPEGEAEVPSYAADLAAAVAAVDNSDVLSGLGMLEERLQERRAAARDTNGASAPTQQPAAAAPPPSLPEPAGAPPPAEPAGAGAPAGRPPALMLGADDLFWVNQLHTGLVDLGYFPGEEDIDDLYFGEGTQSALMTMQACVGGGVEVVV
jgi:hypothetical protein